MTTVQKAERILAYRCEDCGKLEVRMTPRVDAVCPECGGTTIERLKVVGGAVRYSVDDRSHGPSIEDSRLGRMGYFAGWLGFDQIVEVLRVQKEAVARGEGAPKFGDVAVSLRFLDGAQVVALLRVQVIHKGPATPDLSLGALAVREGHISRAQLDECLQVQKNLLLRYQEAPLLGILLTEKKLLSSDQVRELLRLQAEHGVGPLAKIRLVEEGESEEDEEAEEASEAPLDEAGAPVAPTAGELTRERVLCHCRPCGKAVVQAEWRVGDVCPHCGASDFSPVPVAGAEADPSLADEPPGPGLEDGRLGKMAFFAGWLSRSQIRDILRLQEEGTAESGQRRPFGEVAVAASLLSEPQVQALLRMQHLEVSSEPDRTFGTIALRKGFITQEQLDECLDEQRRMLRAEQEAPPLGLLMAEKGLLTDAQVKAILAFQAKYGQGLLSDLESARAEAARGPLRVLFSAARKNSLWVGVASAVVIVFSLAALGTGWFGSMGWSAPALVAGCDNCGYVTEVAATGSRRCVKCGKAKALCPVVACEKCGTCYIYGPRGQGVRCPKCGSEKYRPVRDVAEARASWKLPPPPKTELLADEVKKLEAEK